MEKRTRQLFIRWSIVTGGFIALFWMIWHLIVGEVPTITNVKMTVDWIYVLPFGISRWWDILIGPIWSTIIILLLTNEGLKRQDEDLDFGLAILLIIGLVGGLIIGAIIGLTLGLTVVLPLFLLIGIASGLTGSNNKWYFELAFVLGIGLAGGIYFGLAGALAFGLSVWLGTELGVGIAVFSKSPKIPSSLQTKIWNWLMVR